MSPCIKYELNACENRIWRNQPSNCGTCLCQGPEVKSLCKRSRASASILCAKSVARDILAWPGYIAQRVLLLAYCVLAVAAGGALLASCSWSVPNVRGIGQSHHKCHATTQLSWTRPIASSTSWDYPNAIWRRTEGTATPNRQPI